MKQAKTVNMIEIAREILSQYHPMTVRQVYYQLVSRLVIKNNRSQYQAVSNALVDARKDGVIPWDWIEDRLREPHTVSMWDGLEDFSETVKRAYRKDVWSTQSEYIEVWEEKDALSGIFKDVLRPYGVTLNVGRGYDGWTSINDAAERYLSQESVTVLYFGDFDPSGEDMVRSLEVRLNELGAYPKIVKCALTMEDIQRYHLPPAFAKKSDTRTKKFVAKNGDVSVELDALPIEVLKERIKSEVESRMDIVALNEIWKTEDEEISRLINFMESVK